MLNFEVRRHNLGKLILHLQNTYILVSLVGFPIDTCLLVLATFVTHCVRYAGTIVLLKLFWLRPGCFIISSPALRRHNKRIMNISSMSNDLEMSRAVLHGIRSYHNPLPKENRQTAVDNLCLFPFVCMSTVNYSLLLSRKAKRKSSRIVCFRLLFCFIDILFFSSCTIINNNKNKTIIIIKTRQECCARRRR